MPMQSNGIPMQMLSSDAEGGQIRSKSVIAIDE